MHPSEIDDNYYDVDGDKLCDKKGNLFCANVEWLNDFKKLLGTFKLSQTKLQRNQEYHYYTTM